MKKAVLSLFSFFFLLTGCVQDTLIQPEGKLAEGSDVQVKFTVSIPEYKTLQTQTRASGGLNDMWLLVFDQNGTYITRSKASLSAQSDTEGTFTATLPMSTSERCIHFICNYDWKSFDESNASGSNEASVIALMNSSDVVFWGRVELTQGIDESSFSSTKPVELLRNQAKVSLLNEADNFELIGFTLHKKPAMGTVAPFNKTSFRFEEGTITEPVKMTLLDASQEQIDMTSKYLFERKNKNAAEITTVILEGKYKGKSSFYKIDLIDGENIRYDIERNYHYVVKIKNVAKEGYSNFSDALKGASHNNTTLDPIIEKYPIISDGISKLEVEKTLVIISQAGQTLRIGANFFSPITSPTPDNSGMKVQLAQNDGVLVDGSLSYNAADGIITATAVSTIPAAPSEALIIVSKNDLARTIRVILRKPFSFGNITINQQNPATLENRQGASAILRFSVPNDFPEDLLPLAVKIYAQGLYPASSGLQMHTEQGVVHYVYLITPEKLTDTQTQTIEFKTNKKDNAETVRLRADYYSEGTVNYKSN